MRRPVSANRSMRRRPRASSQVVPVVEVGREDGRTGHRAARLTERRRHGSRGADSLRDMSYQPSAADSTDGPRNRPARKAVIPTGGLATRFLPATKAVPKELLPVVDRPVLQYIVE